MNNLKKLRKQAGISQSALASALGVSQGAVAHYEKGIRRVNVEGAKKIIETLNNQGIDCVFEDLFPLER